MKDFEEIYKKNLKKHGTDSGKEFAKDMFEAGRKSMKKEFRSILHTVQDSPGVRYHYEFVKHKGYKLPSATICRYFDEDVNIAEVSHHSADGEQVLPVAWCYAEELLKALGYTPKFEEIAMSQAWAWYKGNDKK